MAQPIYKLFLLKYKDPWYQLTPEEQTKLMEQNAKSLKKLGVEPIVICASFWASEEWLGWGVEKYPDIEAVQAHSNYLLSLNWFKYIDSTTYLGTEFPQQ